MAELRKEAKLLSAARCGFSNGREIGRATEHPEEAGPCERSSVRKE